MTKNLSQVACFFGLAAFVAAGVGVGGEAVGGSDLYLASEAPAVLRTIALGGEGSWDRSLNSTSDASVRKSDTPDLAQHRENRAACRSVRHERCDE